MRGQNFTQHRRPRVFIAQNGAFDLPAVDAFLDHDPRVEPKGIIHGGGKVFFDFHLFDSDGRAGAQRFDKDGHFKALQRPAQNFLRPGQPVRTAYRDPGHDGNPLLREQTLGDVLVHADGGTGDIHPHIGNPGQLQEPLHGSIFSVRAVEDGKDQIHDNLLSAGIHIVQVQPVSVFKMIDQPGALFFQRKNSAEVFVGDDFRPVLNIPASVAVNADRNDVVFGFVQRRNDGGRRAQRHVMLARSSAV